MTRLCAYATYGLALLLIGGHRSGVERSRLLRAHGLRRTPIGCQVDHCVPLHCGGPDKRTNMQLICGELLKEKERVERDCQAVVPWLALHPCGARRE